MPSEANRTAAPRPSGPALRGNTEKAARVMNPVRTSVNPTHPAAQINSVGSADVYRKRNRNVRVAAHADASNPAIGGPHSANGGGAFSPICSKRLTTDGALA